MAEPNPSSRHDRSRRLLHFGAVFGAIYFAQGICEPTTGLVSQPDQSLLSEWGRSTEQVGAFVSLLTLPWCFKPLFGLLSDFVPLGRYRRKNYLLVSSACAAVAFTVLACLPLPENHETRLLSWLLPASLAVIFGDVAIDALMIETTQPFGMTGRMQSVQWAAIYGGAILTGLGGGYLSEQHRQRLGFLICAALTLGTFVLAALFLEERPYAAPPKRWRKAAPLLWDLLRSRTVLVVGAFLFLWNFNPFSQTVLYLHATKQLDFGDKFFGWMNTVSAVGSLVACVAYGLYCRRVPMRWLVHVSIVFGLISNGIYWLLTREAVAYEISVIFGFTYMTASIIQADLAARACSLDAAGTVYALFMSICNLGSAVSMWLGAYMYDYLKACWSAEDAFRLLIIVNGIFTASCWLVVRYLPEHLLARPVETPGAEPQPLAEATIAGQGAR
ncbi:MAG TPA: MFS transporter [Pirellulales bacterium]|jgi:hypothetical protein|nr:MFS transporter [Pirellulales bacterium]